MKKRDIFSNKFVEVISKMLTLFSIFIYGLFLFNINISTNLTAFVFIVILVILSLFQFYFFIIKNRKGILFTNVHLTILLGFASYGIIKELIFSKYYSRDVNGLVFFIAILLLSLFIINKYKTPTIEYHDLDEIGKPE